MNRKNVERRFVLIL